MTSDNLNFPISVLLVDDDKNICRTLSLSLQEYNCKTVVATTLDSALLELKQRSFDLVLTDFRLNDQTALAVITEAKIFQPKAVSVVMTAFSSIENAVSVVREGAYDYLPKPFTNAQLGLVLKKIRKILALSRENQELRSRAIRDDFFSGFVSQASKRLQDFVRRVAPAESTILISGETGSGKSELARLMHSMSRRAEQPFVTVYCTTLAESLIESELFGHVKGAFTGALRDKVGKLELASGGTLFLDELGDLSLQSQSKLLRFLHERVFEPVGGEKEITVDTRIIAATNKNLREAVSKGLFREDLFYRINAIECVVPPLRARKEDIRVLIEKFTKEIRSKRDLNVHMAWPQEILRKLVQYTWPGNVRELRNTLERIFALAGALPPNMDDLPDYLLEFENQVSGLSDLSTDPDGEVSTLEEVEKHHIAKVLSGEKNLEKASQILGITSVTLWRKRKQYGLE